MPLLCLECHTIYKDILIYNHNQQISLPPILPDLVGNAWMQCPKAECFGNVIDIDEPMIPVIYELRRKGYITDACCSGHLNKKGSYTTYILFGRDIVPKPPRGWTLSTTTVPKEMLSDPTEDLVRAKIDKDYDADTDPERLAAIHANCHELYVWAYRIPHWLEFVYDEKFKEEEKSPGKTKKKGEAI